MGVAQGGRHGGGNCGNHNFQVVTIMKSYQLIITNAKTACKFRVIPVQ